MYRSRSCIYSSSYI